MPRRILAILFIATAVIVGGTAPAQADTCAIEIENLPTIVYPCPGYNDQPVATDVAVVFAIGGPGYANNTYNFVKLKKGGTIFFVNNGVLPMRYHNFYDGHWFDSGIVDGGNWAVVHGVSDLPVGRYLVGDLDNWPAGWLYIDP